MSVTRDAFLSAVDAIQAEAPTYRSGGKAADGTCDCIGLIIGALDRCGAKWPGIHGSNWAARNAMAWMLPVQDAGDLSVGEIVYKAKRPGETGYALPDRYAKDPDRSDYYHVGVVRSVEPLRIVHCTSPGGVVVDTKVGKWAYHGALILISDATDTGEEETVMRTAVVVAESGSTVNLRRSPGGTLVARIPVGTVVEVVASNGAQWAFVSVDGKNGWMDTSFLRMQEGAETGAADGAVASEDAGDVVTVGIPRAAAERLRDALNDVLGRG